MISLGSDNMNPRSEMKKPVKKVRVAVVVWMKPSLKAKLKKVARKAEKSLSSVIRDTMTEAVN